MIPPQCCRNKYLMLKPADHIPMILPQLTGLIVFRQPGVRSSSRRAAGIQQSCSRHAASRSEGLFQRKKTLLTLIKHSRAYQCMNREKEVKHWKLINHVWRADIWSHYPWSADHVGRKIDRVNRSDCVRDKMADATALVGKKRIFIGHSIN